MNIQFYNVKTKQKISIPQEKIKKVKYERRTSQGVTTSYALRAESEGLRLTKFVSKQDWDSLEVPQEKPVIKTKQSTTKASSKTTKHRDKKK